MKRSSSTSRHLLGWMILFSACGTDPNDVSLGGNNDPSEDAAPEAPTNPDGSEEPPEQDTPVASPRIVASESALDFGVVELGYQSLGSIRIDNAGTGSLTVQSIAIVPATSPFSLSSANGPWPQVIASGESARVDVVFAPLLAGLHEATLEIYSDDPDQAVLSIPLRGTGASPAGLSVDPNQIGFGSIPVGCSRRFTVRVSNPSTGPLVVDQLSVQGSTDFRVIQAPSVPITLNVGDSFIVEIEYTPSGASDAIGELLIRAGSSAARVALSGAVESEEVWPFQQYSTPIADVLLVADNSGSMLPLLDELRPLFWSFDGYASSVNLAYQFGLTSAEVGAGTDGNLIGAFITPTLSDPTSIWNDSILLLMQGSGGGIEQGGDAAVRAIDGRNPGFVRSGASLGIIFISDEDDQSTMTNAALLASYRARFPDGIVRINAMVAPDANGCQGNAVFASAAPRTLDLVRSTGGALASICDASTWPTALQLGPGFGLRHRFELGRSVTQTERVSVWVGGIELAPEDPSDQSEVWAVTGSSLRFAPGRAPAAGSAFEVRYAPSCAP